jgi:hypothetical protein
LRTFTPERDRPEFWIMDVPDRLHQERPGLTSARSAAVDRDISRTG